MKLRSQEIFSVTFRTISDYRPSKALSVFPTRHSSTVSSARCVWTLLVLLSLPASFRAQQQNLERAFERAVQLFETGSLVEAESEFRRVSQALPQAPEPYFYLGRICLQTHRATEAEGLLRKTVSLNPEFVDAWKVLGQLYAEQEKYSQAKEALLQVLKREPSNANAHFNLGTALEKLSDDAGAIQEFETAMKLASADSFVYCKSPHQFGIVASEVGKDSQPEPAYQ